MSTPQGIYLKSITFNDGAEISIDRNSILLLTGPNNCGKSQTLREITSHLIIAKKRYVISSIASGFDGNLNEIILGMSRNPFLKQNRPFIEASIVSSGGRLDVFLSMMYQQPHLFNILINGFMTHLSTLMRLVSFGVIADGTQLVNVQPFATTSLTRMYEDQDIARKVYNHTKSAFGKGVLMNHSSFQDADLYYFNQETTTSDLPEGTTDYARWFEQQEKLNLQGDGIQSFAAIMVNILHQTTPLILLDEPEAFLHPPQIRELARLIATETPHNTQLIIATHSDDFVRGMIGFANTRTTVVRMTRERLQSQEINRIKKLDSADIAQLWNDPLLKTSDVLTSLFHKNAIIVEGDSDARFFRTMLDLMLEDNGRLIDTKFFHCGGKDKIPKVVSALRAIGVAVTCVVDIDILDNRTKFLKLVESFGGDVDVFSAQVEALISFVASKKPTPTAFEMKTQVKSLLDGVDAAKPLGAEFFKEIQELVKNPSAWSLVKQSGENFFSGGDPFNNFQQICTEAAKLGILINKAGELENFCRSISAKRKADWLADVLTRDLENDPFLRDARDFTKIIIDRCLLTT